MSLWKPRIEYGATTLDLSLPQEVWTPREKRIGGSRRVASGTGEAYIIRSDRLINMRLRFTEAEWPSVEAWISYALDGFQTFTVYPDQTDLATSRVCDLEAPGMDDEWGPERAEHSGHYTMDVTLRATAGGTFDWRFF